MHKRRYNKVDSWTRMHPDANAEAPDIEELVRLGSAGGPCPFYLSRDMASTADIVFMPYNYLVDAKIRGGLKMVHWPNAVLVFDEAHNVEVIGSPRPHTPPWQRALSSNKRGSHSLHKEFTPILVVPPMVRRRLSATFHVRIATDVVMQGVCSDAASFDLTGALLASALQEVQAAVEVALLKRDGEAQVNTPCTYPCLGQDTWLSC